MPVYLPPINRRKFIRSTSLATAGLLFGLKGTLFGNDNGNVDPDYFILVADTHIDQDRTTEAGARLAEHFQIVVDRVLADTSRRPAGMIVMGDVARTRGLPGDYVEFINIVNPLREAGIPIYLCMGNHDDRDNLWEAVPEKKPDELFVSDKHILIVESPSAYHFILDTLYRVNQTPGLLEKEQLDWLEKTLPDYDDKPVVMYGHHYPEHGSGRGLLDVEDLWDIARPLRHVKAFIYGHSHRWEIANFNHIHGINIPATASGSGGHPTGFVHADYEIDRINLLLETLDTGHAWNGQQGALLYRSDEPTSAEEFDESPGMIQLHQNYPNPFNPKTTIRYEISTARHVNLSVFDAQGRHIANLVNETKGAGKHEVIFDAASLNLASGTYVYRMVSGEKILTRKMSLIQ